MRYVDMNGKEIREGALVKSEDGTVQKIYLTADGELGTDATNPKWIESGRAVPCEYGIYPLTKSEADTLVVVG